MAEARRYKKIDGERVQVNTQNGDVIKSAQQQSQGATGTPEGRLIALEEKMRLLETVIKIQATSIEVLVPLVARDKIFVNGATIMAGARAPNDNPGAAAKLGSLFLRSNGGSGTCLYVKESAGDTGWSSTA